MTQAHDADFRDRLMGAAAVNSTWLMVGLDPVVERLPEGISRNAAGVVEFNRAIVEATHDLVIGYKPNTAFYEVMGAPGWQALQATRALIPPNLIALLDAKRGDIGDTSRMYAKAAFDVLDFDAVTVSPYVGKEGVTPFLERPNRGAFILCRTSNVDSSLQDLAVGPPSGGHRRLYEEVALSATRWGDNVGLVVGATALDSLRQLRALCPRTPFLVPGSGAQGASAREAARAGADGNGDLAIVTASRSILYNSSGRDFAEAARAEAKRMRAEMAGDKAGSG